MSMDHSTRHTTIRLGLGLAGIALLATACGSSGGGSGAGAGATAGSGAGDSGMSDSGMSSSAAMVHASGSTSAAAAMSSSASASAAVTINVRSGPSGSYLTDGSGRTLYLFASDTSHSSSCAGSCLTYWPPLIAHGKTRAAMPLKAAELGTITSSSGGKQVTYAGHPLYYYFGDHGPGQTTGQGSTAFGARWWLVAPSGTAITATGSGSSSSAGNSGGYGGG